MKNVGETTLNYIINVAAEEQMLCFLELPQGGRFSSYVNILPMQKAVCH